jgi:hypothetical protein
VVGADTEFTFRTDHPVGFDSADGPLPDLEIAREDGTRPGHSHRCTGFEVPGATNDLCRSGATIDLAHPNLVGVGVGVDVEHLAHINVGPANVMSHDGLDCMPEHVEDVRQLPYICRREIDELMKPGERDFHRN